MGLSEGLRHVLAAGAVVMAGAALPACAGDIEDQDTAMECAPFDDGFSENREIAANQLGPLETKDPALMDLRCGNAVKKIQKAADKECGLLEDATVCVCQENISANCSDILGELAGLGITVAADIECPQIVEKLTADGTPCNITATVADVAGGFACLDKTRVYEPSGLFMEEFATCADLENNTDAGKRVKAMLGARDVDGKPINYCTAVASERHIECKQAEVETTGAVEED